MLKTFQKHISILIDNPDKQHFLLAVSGGIDSMIMAQLFKESGFIFAIAHCNFGLRGKESDADEAFVKAWAKQNKVHCHTIKFDTEKHAVKKKVSIQMAARELRYTWLKVLQEKHKFNYVSIAHNSDDVIETFFINLLRGTGIAGLHGIAASHQNIIRPLLSFSRKEIEAYAKTIKLKWREDSSNATDKYERNKIRHHLIPMLEKINPHARHAIRLTISNLRDVEEIYMQGIRKTLEEITHHKNGKIYLAINHLKKLDLPEPYIYEAIKGRGFNYAQAKEIAESLNKQAGKTFSSQTHRITKDRTHLILEVMPRMADNKEHLVEEATKQISIGQFDIDFSTIAMHKGYKPSVSKLTACLDYSKLKFPLIVRKWAKGDKFYPLGMNKPKKVSDFLIDAKISIPEKDNVYVLLSEGRIAWIIGHRIDDRFKLTQAAKKIYICITDYVPSL